METKIHKTILIIRDGWGYRKDKTNNAISETPTPNTDRLMSTYPNTLLDASGNAVGLPKGYQGNSEVGHMTLGSGRIIFQSLSRISKSIESKEFFKIQEFNDAIENAKKHNSSIHLIGLLQKEGVHAHIDHLLALLDLCKEKDFKNIKIHIITDGRDSPTTDSLRNLETLDQKLEKLGFGEIVSISGRFYTMDRDERWDRTKKAYDCIVNAKTELETFSNPKEQIITCHKENETDEFIIPRIKENYEGIKENDSVIFFNFRTDRTRQLTKAIIEKDFSGWERKPLNVFFVAMTEFYTPMNGHVAFKKENPDNLLGEVIANNNMSQLRISETEKYAHVTFFFNGQKEKPCKNEERILIHSPKVETYDLKPEMSVYEISDRLIKEIKKEKYEFILINLVNGDMVGHTGIIEAIEKAISAVDDNIGKIVETALEHDYSLLVCADHGNAEDQTTEWRTSHTTNKIPLILISNDENLKSVSLKENKGLQDIAPTVLSLLDIKIPTEMTGENIIK